MVLAISGVSFDGVLKSFSVFGAYGICDVFVSWVIKFKDVCFSAHTPWPKTMTVTV